MEQVHGLVFGPFGGSINENFVSPSGHGGADLLMFRNIVPGVLRSGPAQASPTPGTANHGAASERQIGFECGDFDRTVPAAGADASIPVRHTSHILVANNPLRRSGTGLVIRQLRLYAD